MENPNYYTHTFQPKAERQVTIPVYSVLSTIERQSVEQPEYANINNPKRQMVSPKGAPCQTENLIASPNQESQDLSLSKEGSHVYAQSNLSKKEFSPQAGSGTDNIDSGPNGKFQELSSSEEVRPVYTQPDLSKKKRKKHHFSLL